MENLAQPHDKELMRSQWERGINRWKDWVMLERRKGIVAEEDPSLFSASKLKCFELQVMQNNSMSVKWNKTFG